MKLVFCYLLKIKLETTLKKAHLVERDIVSFASKIKFKVQVKGRSLFVQRIPLILRKTNPLHFVGFCSLEIRLDFFPKINSDKKILFFFNMFICENASELISFKTGVPFDSLCSFTLLDSWP